jgi:pimeloyl-ACP methyl ester carboxylesterase
MPHPLRTWSCSLLAVLVACEGSTARPPVGATIAGCDGATLLASDPDPSVRGVWPVGARTVTIDGLTTEVWYPATPGSDAGVPALRYDIRLALPATEAAKIPDGDNPWQSCDCARDLPLDAARGPFPVIVFVHGTAAFRHQSLALVTHWASRGFVVVAADHPGLVLGDLLAMACGSTPPAQNLGADLDRLFAAIAAPAGDLAFLAGRVDSTRVAVTGHSAGGNAAAAASTRAGVHVVIPMASVRSTMASADLKSSLFFAGTLDSIASPGQVKNAWLASPAPRRYVAIEDGGHLAFSDLCATKNAAGQDLLAIAQAHDVCGAQLAGFLFDCAPANIDARLGWDIINYASTAVLEASLQCQPQRDLAAIKARFPQVSDYAQAL